MFNISQVQAKRLTAVHGWSAVVLGLLLYAVIATGAVAVFAAEIGRWSVGGVRELAPLDEKIGAGIRKLAAQVDPEFLHDGGAWAGEAGDLQVYHSCRCYGHVQGERRDSAGTSRAPAQG